MVVIAWKLQGRWTTAPQQGVGGIVGLSTEEGGGGAESSHAMDPFLRWVGPAVVPVLNKFGPTVPFSAFPIPGTFLFLLMSSYI